MDLPPNTVIIDNGGHTLKVGLAGEDAPRAAVPALVGHSRAPELEIAVDKPGFCVGEKALRRRGLLDVRWPLQGRRVIDFDEMEKLWHHAFYGALRADPRGHACLATVSADFTAADRERAAEVFFEALRCPALHLGDQAVLGLYSTGRTRGVAVDCGHGATHVAPVFEGHVSPYVRGRSAVAGEAVTRRLQQLLAARGLTFSAVRDEETVRAVKEQLCFVAADFPRESRAFAERPRARQLPFALPDGQSLSFGEELVAAPELLFAPGPAAPGELGLAELIGKSHAAGESEVHRGLFEHIVLFGGSTLLPGLPERLCAAVKELSAPPANFAVTASAGREFASWLGGSVFACLAPFASMWVGLREYEERGASALHEKFF